MRCLQAIKVTRVDRLQNIQSERTPLPLNLSQMSSDTGGLGMFAIFKEITLLGKHTNKTSKDSGREEDH